MPTFYDLTNYTNSSIGGLLSLPNSSYPYYWAWILAGIWLILTLSLYYSGKERFGKENLLSCGAIASFPILILSVVGTILTIITLKIMVYTLVISLSLIVIWFYSER